MDGRRRARRGDVVNWILKAGALATALTAIIGLVALLWPDSESSPRLRAQISELQVDPGVTLAEFNERGGKASAELRAPRAARVQLASLSLAQATEPTTPSEPPPRETEPAPQPTPRPLGTQTTLERQLDEKLKEGRVGDVVDLGKRPPSKPQFLKIVTGDSKASPEAMQEVLQGSRLSVATATGSQPKLAPLGVVVNFTVEVEGYKGKRTPLRWSLFDAGTRARMPQEWLRDREAIKFVPEASVDRASSEVWVPLPRERGRYYVRLELFDDKGGRLDFADSERFG